MVVVRSLGIKHPIETILTFCLEINNRILTWEKLRKRGFQGPSFCILCKKGEELTSHLFGTCPYAGQMWIEASRAISQGRMNNMEGTWEQKTKSWWNNKAVCEFNAFPVLFFYTIWKA